MGTFAVVTALIAAVAGIAGVVASVENTKSVNAQNEKINERNLDFQSAQTQAAWERDDNYYQRSVQDAQAAGLSPLAINGAMPNTSPLSAPNPIAMQAPQIDTNGMVQNLLAAGQLGETKRHNESEEALRGAEINNTSKEIQLKAQKLQIDNKDVESQIKYRANMAALESRRIEEVERANKAGESIKEKEYNLNKLSFESKRYYEEIKHQAGGENVPYKVYDDFESYLTAREIYLEAYNNFIDEVGLTRYNSSDSKSSGISAGLNVMGSGVNGSDTVSNSVSEFKDWSQQNQIAWDKFQKQYPVPVFYNKGN